MSYVFKEVLVGRYLPQHSLRLGWLANHQFWLFFSFLLGLARFWVYFFSLEQMLIRVQGILLLELLRVKSVLYLHLRLCLFALFIINMDWSFILLKRPEVDRKNVLNVAFFNVGHFLDSIQKLLRVRSDLGGVARADVVFDLLPVFAVLPQGFNKPFVLIVCPSSLSNTALLTLRVFKWMATTFIHH